MGWSANWYLVGNGPGGGTTIYTPIDVQAEAVNGTQAIDIIETAAEAAVTQVVYDVSIISEKADAEVSR